MLRAHRFASVSPFLPGNSRVYVRINYRFNGSMTKNVKGGLGAGNAGPTSGLLVSLKMRMKSGWGGGGEKKKRNQPVSNAADL